MSKPLTPGEKARRANIRRMKALGARNAKARQTQAMANHLAHIEAMNQRAIDAAAARAARQADGIARRDAHNAALKAAAESARAEQAPVEKAA